MKKRTRSSAAVVLAVAATTVSLGLNLQACELVTDFDRSLIPDASEATDATDVDVATPPFNLDAGSDVDVLPADSGSDASDAGDATLTDAATDAGDAASSDAGDASDAADGDDGGDSGDADAAG